MEPKDAYQFGLLPLVIWREAQNQGYIGMLAVGWVIRNRVLNPSWWGTDWVSVILKKFQFSSFNWNDPNYGKFPKGDEPSWQDALRAALDAFLGSMADPTNGATYYFDRSLDSSPPKWSTGGSTVHTKDIGAFHFYHGN
jgi:spore germination cell wall hydrolase CwlJ-like protein